MGLGFRPILSRCNRSATDLGDDQARCGGGVEGSTPIPRGRDAVAPWLDLCSPLGIDPAAAPNPVLTADVWSAAFAAARRLLVSPAIKGTLTSASIKER